MYLGNDLTVAYPNYRNIDDISASFNGSTTSFALLVNGAAPVPQPLNSQQCLISVGGVLQRPDDTGSEGFRLSGGNIIFSSAPATSEDFFGVVLAGADYVNAGANFPDGQVGAPSITFDQDNDTGFYRSGSGAVSFTSNGVGTATFGSASFVAPSFIPTSSTVPTNGVYLPAANSVAISTNSTSRLYVNSSGSVGIGTTSPQQLLQVGGFSGSNIITIAGGTSGSGSIFFADGTSGSEAYRGYIEYGHAADALQFATGSSERMRIDSSGRLLVGTSTARSNFNNTTDTTRLQIEGTDAATSSFSLVCNNGGGVPVASIHLAKSDGASIGSTGAVANNWDLGDIRFSGSDGTEFVQAASIACEVDGTPGANDMPGRLTFSTTPDGASSPTVRLTIKSDGSIIWGDVYGDTVGATNRDLYIDNTGLMGYVSSIRASKTNISSIENPDWLYQLNPVSFNRRKKNDADSYTDEIYAELEYGLIAEEVEEVAPELCFYDVVDNVPELRGVHYTQLITPMLKALQQANQRIEALEAEVAALKAS